MSTIYHSKYFAYELTKKVSSEKVEKLSQSLFNATIDLNPHQIDAALFAFRSPLSRGAILADEVGLGKTIEAGLIISQLWAERKRRILCILPAALRKQWNRELLEKFFLDSIILETGSYNQLIKQGTLAPLEIPGKVILISYHFARTKASEIKSIPWDLVVIDEAHRLRNVYKKSNKIARSIYDSINSMPKLLLTATPLQNSLMELFGLVRFIDPHVFGNEDSFRTQFSKNVNEMSIGEFNSLKSRLHPICQRTLRRQVLEYIRYTNRIPITQDFTPSEEESRLYNAVSDYLQRPELFALPSSQRSLITLILRKILASSSFAIVITLRALIDRLEKKLSGMKKDTEVQNLFDKDFEAVKEMQEEWNEIQETEENLDKDDTANERINNLESIKNEINELKNYESLAGAITKNAKGDALVVALKKGFEKAVELGAPPKALIFTESCRTQQYLRELLESNGYMGQVVTLNGTNNDLNSKHIYAEWLERNKNSDNITDSKTSDVRSAIVEEFKNNAPIMIATESGAEGINLQFCSLVVNYDLPWNPQRIEQRIGRCHRYGQEHDVVVINFLNRSNAADQHIFEILRDKFKLFSGVFGSSDEILGVIESGVDFEKRINDIYQSCRTLEEINDAFDRLQAELDEKIRDSMNETRSKLLDNFDEDVHTKLKINGEKTKQQINWLEHCLWQLTQLELSKNANFYPENYTFELTNLPDVLQNKEIPLGNYRLITQKNGTGYHHYRLGHPLSEALISFAKSRETPVKEVIFNYEKYPNKISVIENLRNHTGWLQLTILSINALETEEYLIFSAFDEKGDPLDTETCSKLFSIPGELGNEILFPSNVKDKFATLFDVSKNNIISETGERNQKYFESEMEKLELWAEDIKESLERELKELDKEIRLTKKEARQTIDLDTKISLHKKAKDMEKRRNDKRRDLFDAQDKIDTQKEGLISEIEARLKQQIGSNELFTINWRVI
ncbi:MAG: SNF2-related protein [bacterium]|nr:SNF2-related protein [bacterium]